jgi:hypothetical protein
LRAGADLLLVGMVIETVFKRPSQASSFLRVYNCAQII